MTDSKFVVCFEDTRDYGEGYNEPSGHICFVAYFDTEDSAQNLVEKLDIISDIRNEHLNSYIIEQSKFEESLIIEKNESNKIIIDSFKQFIGLSEDDINEKLVGLGFDTKDFEFAITVAETNSSYEIYELKNYNPK